MARIDIDDPYTSFLESQVKAGLFNTISEAARDAIRKQMEAYEQKRFISIRHELSKGEANIINEEIIPYSENLMDDISEKGKRNAMKGKPVKNVVKP